MARMMCIRGFPETDGTTELRSGQVYEVWHGTRCCGTAAYAEGVVYKITYFGLCKWCDWLGLLRRGTPVGWDPTRFIKWDDAPEALTEDVREEIEA